MKKRVRLQKFDDFVIVHVVKYGSDPLKTYLPDSDIDITVIPVTGRTSTIA